MIDEAIRPELESLLRATLAEMIPKVAEARADMPDVAANEVVVLRPRSVRPPARRRRFAIAGLTAAAAIVGLVAVVSRDADRSNSTDGATSTVVATTTSEGPAADHDGTYYSTISPMVMWPHVVSSEPASGATGFGMALCSSGSWTKFTSLLSFEREWHEFEGTLCTFTTLNDPVGESVASCSSMSTGTNYARCQLRTDSSVGAPPTAAKATDDTVVGQEAIISELLPATPPDAPLTFGDQISAAAPSPEAGKNSVGGGRVLLWIGPTAGQTCFTIEATGITSTGCLHTSLLSTGLAYGAFVVGDGPVEMVGIVPDDVATVEIAGKTIAVNGNVWTYTAQPGDDLNFSVFSADHTLSASIS